MAQITNLEHISPFIHSHNPIVQETECNPAKSQKVDSIIHWSILAMRKLTQQKLSQQPVHQLLTFSCRNTTNSYDLLDITAKNVKSLLSQVVASENRFKFQKLSTSQVEKDCKSEIQVAQMEIIEKELEEQFFQLMASILKELKIHIATRYSKNISVEWKDSVCRSTFDTIFDLIKSCKIIGDIYKLSHEDTSKSSDKNSNKPQKRNESTYWKQLLSKLSGDSKVKLELYKLLQANQRKIKSKDEQLDKWIKCSRQFQETVRQQMKWIEFQNQENDQLDQTIETLKDQLKLSEDRIKWIENQTQALQRELAELKQPQGPAESYYINPFYEKIQMEEKIFMEMIEVESQLLLGKEQIRLLTESIFEIVKAGQNLLEDVPGARYYLTNFNRSAFKIMRDIKSMEAFDLECILNIKEDSLYSSEFMQDARKSQISTFSEIQFDQKLSRITEDDCLFTQGQ